MEVHLRDLRYFQAVAEELHFTRAAERLFISQPALSKQIRLLERQLGVRLFERDRRGVQLTAAGKALADNAETVLVAWEQALQACHNAATEAASILVVGIQTSIGRDLQRRAAAEFAARQPGWRLTPDSSPGRIQQPDLRTTPLTWPCSGCLFPRSRAWPPRSFSPNRDGWRS